MSIKTSKYSLFIAIFIILSLSVSALNEDFDAFSQKDGISACSGQIMANSITIHNIGDIESVYSVTKSGSMAPYTVFTEEKFTLEPGETKLVESYMNPPYGEGQYDLITKIETIFGLSKIITQNVKVEKCVNIRLYVKDVEKEGCPCTTLVYELELKNNGAIAESYRFSLSEYDEYASFSENPVILGSGESKEIFLYLNLPCNVYGEKEVNLVADAEKSEYQAVAKIKFNLDRECYDYEISANKTTICNFDKKTSFVEIVNKADIKNVYTFSVKGKDFVEFINDTYLLYPNSAASIPLAINTYDVDSGKYNFTIKTVSERGLLEKEAETSVEVQNCYGLDMVAEKTYDKLISCEKASYGVTITNPGVNTNTYNLVFEGSDIFGLSANSATVAPQSEGAVSLNIDVPCNLTGKRYGVLTATLLGKPEISKSLRFGYEIYSVAEGYMLEFDVPKRTIEYDTGNVSIVVKNAGIRKGEYQFSVVGPPWVELSEKSAVLNPGEGKEFLLITTPANETMEGEYEISVIAQLENSDIAYKSSFNLKLIRIPLTEKIYNSVKEFLELYWLFVVLGIVILIALILLLSALRKTIKIMKERPKGEKLIVPKEEVYGLKVEREISGRKIWGVLLPILLALLVVGAIILIYSNMPSIAGIFKPVEKEGEKTNMLVDRAGLLVVGKTIFIDSNETLKVIVKNKEDRNATYNIKVNVPWIDLSTDRLELQPYEAKLFFMRLSPPEDGIHVVSIALENMDKSYKEVLELRVINKSYFMKYWGYLVGALAALIVLLLILRGKKTKLKVKDERIEFRVVKEKKMLKRIGLGVVIVLLLASIGYIVYNNIKVMPEIDFGDVGNETFRLDITKNEQIILPFTFGNKFEDSVLYKIDVDEEWIDVSATKIKLETNETKYAEIVMAPGEDVEGGIYIVEVSAEVMNQSIKYTKTIELYVKSKSMIQTFIYWLTALLIIILVITTILNLKRNYKNKKIVAEEIKNEIAFNKKIKKRKGLSLKEK